MMDEHLMADEQVAEFIVNGYHVIEPVFPEGFDEGIAQQLDRLEKNPGDAIIEVIPDLQQVLDHPAVKGVLVSLLGHDYRVHPHRHWHCRQPGDGYLRWHQDGTNNRDVLIRRFLGLYYPRDVTADMGPTIVVPGTQYRNAPTDRMATYTNIRGQVPLVVSAGTVAFTHYDMWHGTSANRSSVKRHMIKFLFERTKDNTGPSWNHDPEMEDTNLDWGDRSDKRTVANILAFDNPLHVEQSDHYKERAIRRRCWDHMLGRPGLESERF